MPYQPRHRRQPPYSSPPLFRYFHKTRKEYLNTPVEHSEEDKEHLEAFKQRGVHTQEDYELLEQLKSREEDRHNGRTATLKAEIEGYFKRDDLRPLPPPVWRSSMWLEMNRPCDYKIESVREFLVACEKGDFGLVTNWITSTEKKAALRRMGLNDGLACASMGNRVEICRYLLDNDAQINARVVQEACKHSYVDLFKVLIQHEYHPDQQVPSGHGHFGTALLHCLISEEVTSLLLTHGADPNLGPFRDGRTAMWSTRSTPPMDRKSGLALDTAVAEHEERVVRLLLEHGAKTEHSRPFLAVVRQRVNAESSKANEWQQLFDLFLEHGADINGRSWGRGTALSVAVSRKRWDIVEYLLRHGADPRVSDPDPRRNKDALKIAAEGAGLQWGEAESENVYGYILDFLSVIRGEPGQEVPVLHEGLRNPLVQAMERVRKSLAS